jgi:hypothetical protein
MPHCNHFLAAPFTRRQMLSRCACGFGAVALAALMDQPAMAVPLAGAARPAQFRAKAKNVIFLYMDGGPSHIDTFDYKPMLDRYDGQDPLKAIGKLEPTQFANVGKVMASPWKFRRHGQSGAWVSELFPQVAKVVDDLAFVRSITSEFSEHTTANYFLHTGSGLQGRPSMGAWTTYGLGSESQNLPGFVVINGGLIPPGGVDNFNSGFLPATYQGSVLKPQMPGIANATPTEQSPILQQRKLALMRKLDSQAIGQMGRLDAVESAIANYELAYKMQSAVPELMNLSGESAATKTLYGFDADYPQTRVFAAECLLARRLVERGVRFVELTCPGGNGDRWDQHTGLRDGHEKNCKTVDQPIAGLIQDLKSRGLLDETLVVWAGEFGRTPFAQGVDGRDHNPYGFTIWLAGGGIKAGTMYGATDDWGYKAIDGRCTIHDLHATMLHLLGIDHTKLTFRYSGRDMRLTDVYGEVLRDILA